VVGVANHFIPAFEFMFLRLDFSFIQPLNPIENTIPPTVGHDAHYVFPEIPKPISPKFE